MHDAAIWKNYFDIVILPPAAVRDHAIALSVELRKYGGLFILGKRSYLPHISLYHLPVRPERFETFSKDVRDVALEHPGGSLRLKGIDMPLLMTDKPAWLRRLHLDMVKATAKHFDTQYGAEERWNLERLASKLRPLARHNLKQFGSPMIDPLFRPHLTLTSFEEMSMQKEIRPDFQRMAFEVDQIAICELGPHHSCQRIVGIFQLRAKRGSQRR